MEASPTTARAVLHCFLFFCAAAPGEHAITPPLPPPPHSPPGSHHPHRPPGGRPGDNEEEEGAGGVRGEGEYDAGGGGEGGSDVEAESQINDEGSEVSGDEEDEMEDGDVEGLEPPLGGVGSVLPAFTPFRTLAQVDQTAGMANAFLGDAHFLGRNYPAVCARGHKA